jgi:hypothetical protein
MANKYFTTVSWRKYLIPTTDRIIKFLDSRGVDVMNQISQIIDEANRDSKKEVTVMIHPNLSSAILIKEKDYVEVLNICLDFLIKKEEYEKCSNIQLYKEKIKKN